MRIDFQQGIITYPSSNNQQVFLAKRGNNVSLQTANGRTDITFAHKSENYLFTETTDTLNAWGPLSPNTDYWLYWDINPLNAVRTFGFTTILPLFGTTQPSNPTEDQHWFNTSINQMFVFHIGGWREVIRVFAAKVNNTTFTGMATGSIIAPFSGTQAQLRVPNQSAGRITVDNTGSPIRRANGQFFTTEDEFFINGSPANTIRLESNILNAQALENIAKYQVVKFTQFEQINLASYNDIQTTIVAMSMEDVLFKQVGTLCIQGVITNPDWNFTVVGAPLWVSDVGELTEEDLYITSPLVHQVPKVPIARVLSPTSIYFDQGMGGIGSKGDTGKVENLPVASTVLMGVSKLSVSATDPSNPIVVETNDPRLLPYIHPSTHSATIITTDNHGILTGSNVQTQLHQLADRTLDSISDVSTTTASINDYLKFNGNSWISAPIVFPNAPYLGQLQDVIIPNPTVNDYLKWNGIDWINSPLPTLTTTLTGDITGSGTTSISTTLSDTGVSPGTYNNVTVDSKGRITSATMVSTLPYDIAYYIATTPYDINTILTGFLSPRTVTILSGASHIAKCSTAPTVVSTTFILKRNGAQVATVVFAVGAYTGTITFTAGSTLTISPGDVLNVSTSGTIDGVIAGIGITLVGTSNII